MKNLIQTGLMLAKQIFSDYTEYFKNHILHIFKTASAHRLKDGSFKKAKQSPLSKRRIKKVNHNKCRNPSQPIEAETVHYTIII